MKSMAIAVMAATITLSAVDAGAAGAPRPGFKPGPSTTQPGQAPAGMPSFHQPSYSIDRKDWWQPHPYFQPNGQGYGYPSYPGHRHPGHPGHRR